MQFLEILEKMLQESTDWLSTTLSAAIKQTGPSLPRVMCFLRLDSNTKLTEKSKFLLENERFIVCFRQSSDTLQCAFGRPCVTSWKKKKARLLSVIYIVLFLKGPLIFVIKSMSRVVSSRSKAEWFWSKYCLDKENVTIACVLLAKIPWDCCKVNSSILKLIPLPDMYLQMGCCTATLVCQDESIAPSTVQNMTVHFAFSYPLIPEIKMQKTHLMWETFYLFLFLPYLFLFFFLACTF